MRLDFTSEVYKEKALSINNVNYNNNITSADAFFIVLAGLDYETIDNLCEAVKNILAFQDSKKIYEFIQTGNCNIEFRQIVLDTAYELIHSNINLGNKIVNEKYNASAWIAHSLYEGEVASTLASKMNLDEDTAKKLGILHDIGRKFDHTFMHVIKGYEYLLMKGLKDEAICSLTHSFLSIPYDNELKGNRCANCDPSCEGFYIDELGNGLFKEEKYKDDITLFLEKYNYNEYDVILNISDLMAMSSGIVSPYDRVDDVYTRKTPDPINSSFFKVCFINTLRRVMYSITNDDKYIEIYNINEVSDIENLFINTSNEFMQIYNNLIKNNSKVIK